MRKASFSMTKESPLNFFHSAAKKPKPTEPAAPLKQQPSVAPKAVAGNPAIENMLERMNQMRREIDDQIDALTREHGLSDERIKQYLGNPSNFSPEQWEFLQQKDNELSQKIWAAVEPLSSTVTIEPQSISLQNPSQGSTKEPSTASRKGKFVGSRRKWIPT